MCCTYVFSCIGLRIHHKISQSHGDVQCSASQKISAVLQDAECLFKDIKTKDMEPGQYGFDDAATLLGTVVAFLRNKGIVGLLSQG